MTGKNLSVTIFIFFLSAAGIVAVAFWPFAEKQPQERYRTRVIVPSVPDDVNPDSAGTEDIIYEESYTIKAPLADGEFAISVLNFDFDNNTVEEQVVVYRSLTGAENPISITLFAYDEDNRAYRRLWNVPVAATMPGTISIYADDLIGDRNSCVIITGMNARNEHTMTIFRRNQQAEWEQPFNKIAEIQTDGSITIQEATRPLAYQQGIATGQPFAITASGHDSEAGNMLDRIEIAYTFNSVQGIYEQGRVTRLPGAQIEERRVQEILSGSVNDFENFIDDLWYHVNPQGTVDQNQYLYFDPAKREIIFFGDETQQVFTWQNSNSTRYGIYVSSQNISVTTLRRFLDIEMQSFDSIHIRVYEDVKLKIGMSAPWDGSYRRAGTTVRPPAQEKTVRTYTDAVYDSSLGRLRFHATGEYELSSGGSVTRGRYAFFQAGDEELLELRPAQGGNGSAAVKTENGENRQIYKIAVDDDSRNENLSLSRVRLGSGGIHDLHETQIILTKAQ